MSGFRSTAGLDQPSDSVAVLPASADPSTALEFQLVHSACYRVYAYDSRQVHHVGAMHADKPARIEQALEGGQVLPVEIVLGTAVPNIL